MATANNLYTFTETAGALIIIFNQNKIYFFSNEKKKKDKIVNIQTLFTIFVQNNEQ